MKNVLYKIKKNFSSKKYSSRHKSLIWKMNATKLSKTQKLVKSV